MLIDNLFLNKLFDDLNTHITFSLSFVTKLSYIGTTFFKFYVSTGH